MKPSLGRIVHYTLSDQDAAAINRRRADARAPLAADLVKAGVSAEPRNLASMGTGAQVHFGNEVRAGDVYPLVITRVWAAADQVAESTAVNGQLLLDGNDTLWVTSVTQGTDARQWFAPPRV